MADHNFETELKAGFLDEAAQLLGDAEQCFLALEGEGATDPAMVDKIFRLAHNLKGSAKAVGFDTMAELTHELESLLLKIKNQEVSITGSLVSLMLRCKDHLDHMVSTLRDDQAAVVDSSALTAELKAARSVEAPAPLDDPKPVPGLSPEEIPPSAPPSSEEGLETAPFPPEPAAPAPTTPALPKKSASSDESIRVSLARVEKLVNFVGELVILQTVLQDQKERRDPQLLGGVINELSKVTKEIQSLSMGLRLIPLKQTFQKMQRIVRDTSTALGKKTKIEVRGEDTELDKTVLENINDPLVHLVRNAVDHGLESAEERAARGKPDGGTITLTAFHRADRIVIEVGDDGGGLDPEKLRRKALEKDILSEKERLTEQDALQLIFRPGFSTKAEVTDISGRGVGLDVVKTNIEGLLHGEVQVSSKIGVGTTFRIILPLTLAIIDGMTVRIGKERYVIPLAQVHETIRPEPRLVHHVAGLGEVLNLRGESLTLHHLGSLLRRKSETKLSEGIAIIARYAQKPFAVLVDDILGKQQVVIKQLGPEHGKLRGLSGSAILGDGKPALILELNELIRAHAAPATRAEPARKTAS